MADQSRNDRGGMEGQHDAGPGGDRRNPADNLSREDRIRGGERSASMQHRDQRGQFAGRKGKPQDENRQSRSESPQGDIQQQGRAAGGAGMSGGGMNR